MFYIPSTVRLSKYSRDCCCMCGDLIDDYKNAANVADCDVYIINTVSDLIEHALANYIVVIQDDLRDMQALAYKKQLSKAKAEEALKNAEHEQSE